jgi:amidophosphoribosyltransferase
MAGLLGHGDAFVFRDPAELDQHYYQDDEIVVVASERPMIKLYCPEEVHEIDPGKALIIKKNGSVSMKFFLQPLKKPVLSCIYFQKR